MSKQVITEVAANHNWRDRVNSEIKSQLSYATEWGATLKQAVPSTLEAQIEAKERELEELKAATGARSSLSTTSSLYGSGRSLERFGVAENGIKRDKGITPSR